MTTVKDDTSELKLFRTEVLEARRPKWYGEILLSRPPAATSVVLVAVALASLLIALLYYGTYTRRVAVMGQLLPAGGIAKIHVPQAGVVAEVKVAEGQHVRKGDTLFAVSSERRTQKGETQSVIAEQEQVQKQLLIGQVRRSEQLQAAELATMRDTIERLQQELPQVDRQISNQRTRIDLAQHNLERYLQLQKPGYVTNDQVIQKRAELLELEGVLGALERDRINVQHSLREARAQLATVPLKYANQIAELEGAAATIEQSIVENELRREFLVTAPESGVIGALLVHAGQWVDGGTPLASIAPENQTLVAELYVPSRAIGMLKDGDEVHIRHQAFPFQKFGQQRGVVQQITEAAVSSAELARTNAFDTGLSPNGEPLYRVTVKLDSQFISAYGKPQMLRAGMQLEADVRSETRRLYEWILEPLYSLGKKL